MVDLQLLTEYYHDNKGIDNSINSPNVISMIVHKDQVIPTLYNLQGYIML